MEETPKQHYSEKVKNEIFNNEFLPHISPMYNFGYRLTLNRDDVNPLFPLPDRLSSVFSTLSEKANS